MNLMTAGLTALTVGRRGLDLVGQNIANATTPGYHRQSLNLVSKTLDGVTGAGVDVASITRYTAPPLRTAIIRGNADQADAEARLGVRRQVETALDFGTSGTGERLESFFNQLGQLTARPDDIATRRPVLATAVELASGLRTAANDLDQLRGGVAGDITNVVTEVNDFAAQIANLNQKIMQVEVTGGQPNDLLDQRDQLLNELSKRVDIRTVPQPYGAVNVIASGSAVVVGEFATKYQVTATPTGQLTVTQQGATQPTTFASGKLGGLLREYNTDLPATRARLDAFAGELIRRVNAVQATGLGTSGPLTAAPGTTPVANATAPLATQNLPFPLTAGQLVISITDSSTGQRTNSTVAIDPTTQSLQDVATAITSTTGGRVQATVTAPDNTLRFDAQPGFTFDFAGRDTNPPSSGTVANTDTAGLLVGLGVNGLFNGTNASSIEVRPEVVADPRLLASSRSGQPGDASNLVRFVDVRDQTAIAGRTLPDELADQAASVGSEVKSLGDRQSVQDGLLQRLVAQEEAVRGVDLNEELVQLLDYQRMIEGASRYLSVVNRALDVITSMAT